MNDIHTRIHSHTAPKKKRRCNTVIVLRDLSCRVLLPVFLVVLLVCLSANRLAPLTCAIHGIQVPCVAASALGEASATLTDKDQHGSQRFEFSVKGIRSREPDIIHQIFNVSSTSRRRPTTRMIHDEVFRVPNFGR